MTTDPTPSPLPPPEDIVPPPEDIVPTPEDIVLVPWVQPPPKPWGFWPTIAFSLLALIAFVGLQVAVMIVWAVASTILDPKQSMLERIVGSAGNDVVMTASVWTSSLGCTAVLALCVLLRPRWSLREYLGLKTISLRSAAAWSGATIVAILVAELATFALGTPIPKELLDLHRNAAYPLLLVSSIVIAAPWIEEIFFRGFFFRGVAASKLGAPGAILLGSAIWTSLHCYYPPMHLAMIFALGLLLGVVRARTGSVSITILMHAIWNAVSCAEMFWLVHTTP